MFHCLFSFLEKHKKLIRLTILGTCSLTELFGQEGLFRISFVFCFHSYHRKLVLQTLFWKNTYNMFLKFCKRSPLKCFVFKNSSNEEFRKKVFQKGNHLSKHHKY